VENFRPSTLERWGLSWEVLSALNPRLVMVRVTGFGQTGPYAAQAGFGAIGEALGGLRYVVGDPASPPSRVGISIGDTLAAMFAALGGLMALHARQRSGKGQVVDSAIYEAVLAVMESLVPEYQLGGFIRERTGSILPNIAPSNVYPTADGQMVVIGANQDNVFKRFAAAMGRPELALDPRYATHSARGEHQQELDDLIAAWTRTLEAARLQEVLVAAGVPAGRMYRAPEMLADPHFQAREAIVRILHPTFGEMAMQNAVPKLSGTPGRVSWTGPELGQHNAEIYQGLLGMGAAELEDLRARRIV
jgi:formyl-CoA transferase